MLLVFFVIEGTRGPNARGADPKMAAQGAAYSERPAHDGWDAGRGAGVILSAQHHAGSDLSIVAPAPISAPCRAR